MVKVRAQAKGYVGGILREPGDVFDWPEGNVIGSWVKPFAFGGKGDHDGDGLTGGSVPADVDDEKPKKGKGKAKAETVEAPSAQPFADAPEPETIKGNGVQAALGVQPDWIAPSGDEKPVSAD